MRTVAQHMARAMALVAPLPTVDVPLDEVDGYVLADQILALEALPRWDNSAMDGYAVRVVDLADASPDRPVDLLVLADLAAGADAQVAVASRTSARIMTGARVPVGADAIVPVEDTDGGTARVRITRPPRMGSHIRRRGEDAAPGDLVLAAGTVLGPAQVAAAAAVGFAQLPVHRRPRVAVISTGAELVAPGQGLQPGQIPDSNSFLLAAAVRGAGCEAVRFGAVPDDPGALRELLADIVGSVDVVVTSGGVSKGAFDVVKEVLSAERDMEFVEVAMQPGKPQGLGRLASGTPVFALPGNPVSAFVSFEVFVRPALLRLRGVRDVHRLVADATAQDEWRTPVGRAQYMPVAFVTDGQTGVDGPAVRRAARGGSGSHLVVGLGGVQGLAIVPAHQEVVAHGDTVRVMRVDQ